MKRNFFVGTAVVVILALFALTGWLHYEHRKLALGRAPQQAAPGQPAQGAAQSSSQSAEQAESPFGPSLNGKPAPAFTLEDTHGRKVSLADYKGKALLINFWATWCGPCKIETPWLIDLRNRYAAQGFEVLGVSMDDLDRNNPHALAVEKQEIAQFAAQMHVPYPVLIGGDSISDAYGGLVALPTSFYVNRKGIVVATQMGIVSQDEIEANIKKALEAGK